MVNDIQWTEELRGIYMHLLRTENYIRLPVTTYNTEAVMTAIKVLTVEQIDGLGIYLNKPLLYLKNVYIQNPVEECVIRKWLRDDMIKLFQEGKLTRYNRLGAMVGEIIIDEGIDLGDELRAKFKRLIKMGAEHVIARTYYLSLTKSNYTKAMGVLDYVDEYLSEYKVEFHAQKGMIRRSYVKGLCGDRGNYFFNAKVTLKLLTGESVEDIDLKLYIKSVYLNKYEYMMGIKTREELVQHIVSLKPTKEEVRGWYGTSLPKIREIEQLGGYTFPD